MNIKKNIYSFLQYLLSSMLIVSCSLEAGGPCGYEKYEGRYVLVDICFEGPDSRFYFSPIDDSLKPKLNIIKYKLENAFVTKKNNLELGDKFLVTVKVISKGSCPPYLLTKIEPLP